MSIAYKHSYAPLSMYGNVISLLREHAAKTGVHVDIGCGYGAIAEPVRDELGLTYLGFDIAEDGLESLKDRDFYVHAIDLYDLEAAEGIVREAVGDRTIASLTFLDTMEHLTNGPDVLAMLRRLADGSNAPLVISVPNITHKDVALKLLMGRLDVTEAGILDYTHVALFSDSHLKRVTTSRGWSEIAARDWLLERSDQFFPSDSLLNFRTVIGSNLRSIIDQANEHALVNQFVRAYVASDVQPIELYGERTEPERPFLSILIDAYEMSDQEAEAVLQDLELQTSQDFDIIFITEGSDRTAIGGALSPVLARFDDRASTVATGGASRSERLNEGSKAASGRFLAVLIEGDRLETRWVSSFASLVDAETAAVLRVGRARSLKDVAADGSERIFPAPLRGPESVAEWAVPCSFIRDLGFQFDPDLGIGDLREFVVQSALSYGALISSETMVSQTNATADDVGQSVDDDSYLKLLTKINANPLLLPAGSAERIERFSELARIGKFVVASPLLAQMVASYSDQVGAGTVARSRETDFHPFLSVIIRTQASAVRIDTLREAILTLAGQTSQNFEVMLVVHTDDEARFSAVEALVAEFPIELTRRISLLQCTRPGRASPINDAVEKANGDYIAVFDDDDLLFAHWVEMFEKCAAQSPGSVLRTVAVRQDFKITTLGALRRPRAESWFTLQWPSEYNAVEHLRTNFTPFMSMAFPIGMLRQLGLRFDESLSTAEDWELATRAAMACGVFSVPDVTAIYRWWTNGESSGFLHEREEWYTNRQRILARLNTQPILLPPGSSAKLTALLDEVLELRRRVGAVEPPQVCKKPKPPRGRRPRKEKRDPSQRLLRELLESRSWRSTRPVRKIINMFRGQSGSGLTPDQVPAAPKKAQKLIEEVRTSLSWRITVPLRKAAQLARRTRGRKPD